MYTIKHETSSDTKSIVDPEGRELVRIEDLHNELIELLHRARRAESVSDHLESRTKDSPPIDWAKVQIDATISAMHAILSSKNYMALLEFSEKSRRDAKAAVNYAYSLVAQLQELLD